MNSPAPAKFKVGDMVMVGRHTKTKSYIGEVIRHHIPQIHRNPPHYQVRVVHRLTGYNTAELHYTAFNYVEREDSMTHITQAHLAALLTSDALLAQ